MSHPAQMPDLRARMQDLLPKLVLAPSLIVVLIFVYGFIAYTVALSFTGSKMMPSAQFVGLAHYARLWALKTWRMAISNIGIFAVLYIGICTLVGVTLAILLDQKIRGEGGVRPI